MENSSQTLAGKVAIVTGASRGIGRAIAQEFARAGAMVAVIARSREQVEETVALIRGAGGSALSVIADIISQEQVRQALSETERHLGPVDILVNNAGRLESLDAFWEVDPWEWWRDVEVNLRGTFLMTRAVLPGMVARRGGTIISLSGGRGTSPSTGNSAYITSKTAVVRLTECLAVETREYGIRAFAMGPGLVVTEMTEKLMNTPEGRRWQPAIGERVSRGENVPPERSAQLALFLATRAGPELSGRLLEIYDDQSELITRSSEIQQDDLYVLRVRK